jgi:hypothetical protein
LTHPTLAAGLADAMCPTLYVYSGTYAERVTVSRQVTVVAVGAEPVVIDGGAAGTVVTIDAGAMATLRGFTIRNGMAPAGGGLVNRGTLTLDAMTVSDNVAMAGNPAGGGIDNAGTLTLMASAVTHNRLALTAAAPSITRMLSGAGIRSTTGTVSLNAGSQIEANEIVLTGVSDAIGQGAGIYAENTAVQITGASLVRNNVLDVDIGGDTGEAIAEGAGLWLSGGTLTLDGGSAIESNTASARGGGFEANATGGGFFTTSTAIKLDAAFVQNNQAVAIGTHDVSSRAGGGYMNKGSLEVTNTAIVANMVLADGSGSASAIFASALGGGLEIDDLSATITDSQLSSNIVSGGITSMAFSGSALAGALSTTTSVASQTVTLLRCTLDGNQATASRSAEGGAISATPGSGTVLDVNVLQTTISNNLVRGSLVLAGAVFVQNTSTNATVNVNLVNSTVSGNRAEAPMGDISASAQAGGILGFANSDTATVNINLASTTVTNNSATGMRALCGGLLLEVATSGVTTGSLKNSIVAGNNAATDPDCTSSKASITSGGYNLIGSAGSCTLGGTLTGNLSGAPGLGPLSNNGGATWTHAPMPGSQTINAADPAGCTDLESRVLGSDQRGQPRISGGRCDIGALEL